MWSPPAEYVVRAGGFIVQSAALVCRVSFIHSSHQPPPSLWVLCGCITLCGVSEVNNTSNFCWKTGSIVPNLFESNRMFLQGMKYEVGFCSGVGVLQSATKWTLYSMPCHRKVGGAEGVQEVFFTSPLFPLDFVYFLHQLSCGILLILRAGTVSERGVGYAVPQLLPCLHPVEKF